MKITSLQRHVLSLDKPVVTASGFQDQLAVVTHVSDCLPSNDQVLEFRVFNIAKGTQPLKGLLPLTPGSQLTWFGFSEEGQLSSYDSKGVLNIYTSLYGVCWLPIFSASKGKKSDENYWIVGLNTSKLFCIVCKNPALFPQVMPKPVLTLLDLSFPIASSDLGAETLENEFIMNNFHLSQERLLDETKRAPNISFLNSNNNVATRGDAAVGKASTSTERCEMSEPVVPSSSAKFSLPLFKKKDKSPEGIKLGSESTSQNQNANLENREVKSTEATNGEAMNNQGERKAHSQHTSNAFVNHDKVNQAGEVNQAQPHRSGGGIALFHPSKYKLL